jgi:hypothetical protein
MALTLIFLVGGAYGAFAAVQQVTTSADVTDPKPGDSVAVTVSYDTDDHNGSLFGLGIKVHYDSSKLQYVDQTGFTPGGIDIGAPVDGTEGTDDSNANTDREVTIGYASSAANWPLGAAPTTIDAPIDLLTLNFTVKTDAALGSTPVTVTYGTLSAGYTGEPVDDLAITVTPPDVAITTDKTVLSSNGLGTAMITADISDDFAGATTGETLQLTLSDATYVFFSDAAGNPVNNDGAATTETITFNTAGVASIYLTSASGTVGTTQTFNVTRTGGSLDLNPVYGGSATATSLSFSVVDFGITPALPQNMRSGESMEFTANGATSVAWTFSAGTPSTSSALTVDYTAPINTDDTPTEVAVVLTDSTGTFGTTGGSIFVYSTPEVVNLPTDGDSIIAPGTSKTYTVEGGLGSALAWTVTKGGVTVDSSTGSSYTFVAPTTGDFAGDYTISVTDGLGTAESFDVSVPYDLDAVFTIIEDDIITGTAYTGQTMALTGVADGATVTAMLMSVDSEGNSVTGLDETLYGTLTATVDGTDATQWNIVHAGIDFTAIEEAEGEDAKQFNARVTIDGTDVDFGLFNLFFVEAFNVVTTQTGVTVTMIGPEAYDDDTNPHLTQTSEVADETLEFLLPDNGAKYTFIAEKAGFVPAVFNTLDDFVGGEFTVTLDAVAGTISGTVTDGTNPIAGAEVYALDASDNQSVTVETDAAGAYTIYFSAIAVDDVFTIVASADFYENAVLDVTVTDVNMTGQDIALSVIPRVLIEVDSAPVSMGDVVFDVTGASGADANFDDAVTFTATAEVADGVTAPTIAVDLVNGEAAATFADEAVDFQLVVTVTAIGALDLTADPLVVFFNYAADPAEQPVAISESIAVAPETGGFVDFTPVGLPAGTEIVVEIPAGALPAGVNAVVSIGQLVNPDTTDEDLAASGDFLFQINILDDNGDKIEDLGDGVIVTVPVDLSKTTAAELFAGTSVVRYAATLAELGTTSETVVASSAIVEVDPGDGTIGSVTFPITQDPVVGIGAAPAPAAAGGGGGGNCFISTAENGAMNLAAVSLMLAIGGMFLAIRRRRN